MSKNKYTPETQKRILLETLELVQKNNPEYEVILENIDTNLGSNVWSEFTTESNGNLVIKKESNEIKALVARALNVNHVKMWNQLKDNNVNFATDIVFEEYKDREVPLKYAGTLFKGSYEVRLNKIRTSKDQSSSSRSTISAKPIIDTLKEIQKNYAQIKEIHQNINQIKSAVQTKDATELARITQIIAANHKIDNEEVMNNIKYIYEIEQNKEEKKQNFISNIIKKIKNFYYNFYQIDPKKELDAFFTQTQLSIPNQSISNTTTAETKTQQISIEPITLRIYENIDILKQDISNTLKMFNLISRKSDMKATLNDQTVILENPAFIAFKNMIGDPSTRTKKNFDDFAQKIDSKYELEGWNNQEKRIEKDIIKYQLASVIASHPAENTTDQEKEEMKLIKDAIFVNLADQQDTKIFSKEVQKIKLENPKINEISIGKSSNYQKFKDIFTKPFNLKNIQHNSTITDVSNIPLISDIPNYPPPPAPKAKHR